MREHADLSREAEREGHGEQVHHDAAVHREELVVRLRAQDAQARLRELRPHAEREETSDAEEPERRHEVAQPDHLVIRAREPAQDPGVAARDGRRRGGGTRALGRDRHGLPPLCARCCCAIQSR